MKTLNHLGYHLLHEEWTDMEILLICGIPSGIIAILLCELVDFSHLF